MKKIIGILGVAVIAATMFFSVNNLTGSSSDVSLASLIGMNSANAEFDFDEFFETGQGKDDPKLPIVKNAIGDASMCVKVFHVNIDPKEYELEIDIQFGTRIDCSPGGGDTCQPTVCL